MRLLYKDNYKLIITYIYYDILHTYSPLHQNESNLIKTKLDEDEDEDDDYDDYDYDYDYDHDHDYSDEIHSSDSESSKLYKEINEKMEHLEVSESDEEMEGQEEIESSHVLTENEVRKLTCLHVNRPFVYIIISSANHLLQTGLYFGQE